MLGWSEHELPNLLYNSRHTKTHLLIASYFRQLNELQGVPITFQEMSVSLRTLSCLAHWQFCTRKRLGNCGGLTSFPARSSSQPQGGSPQRSVLPPKAPPERHQLGTCQAVITTMRASKTRVFLDQQSDKPPQVMMHEILAAEPCSTALLFRCK